MRTPTFVAFVPALLLGALVCVADEVTVDPTPPEAADREKMEDDVLRKQGYKVTTVKGEKRYCKKENVLGSRLNAQTICWTADQIKANKDEADILREKQGQRQTF